MRLKGITFLSIFCMSSLLKGVGTQFVNVPGSVGELVHGTQSAMVYFPENLLDKTSISISHNDWFGGFSVFGMGISSPLFGGQALFRVKYGGFENIELRDESPSDSPLSFYSAFGTTVSGGIKYKLEGYEISSLVQMLHLRIHTHSSSGFSGSLAIAKPILRDWKIGVALSHAGSMDQFVHQKPKLPFSGNIVISKTSTFKEFYNKFFLSGGYIPSSKDHIILVNNTISWKNIGVTLASHISNETSHISGGFSIKLGLYQFEYGFRIGDHQLGIPQVIDLSVTLP